MGETRDRTPSVTLWRQDDNGNRFVVAVFSDRATAEERMAELTRSPHKQSYWIEEGGRGPTPE